jgi:hypothetical protein
MRRLCVLTVLVCAFALTGCVLWSPVGENAPPAVTTVAPIHSEAPSTEPIPTERETETDTPKTEYFPNETDDDHTKRY